MDLSEAKQILGALASSPIASANWDQQLTLAIQRGLAELMLLNPDDDVDGSIGPRTRSAWELFKTVAGLAGADTIEAASAQRLTQEASNRTGWLGQLKVQLQPEFAFRRGAKNQAPNRQNSTHAIIAAARAIGLSKAQIAYILATAEHESDSFHTLEEYSNGSQYEGRAELGNTQKGDGVRYKGRGYVQLTGRRNYTLYANKTGIKLDRLPPVLMNWAALSVYVIVDGMTNGVYTGHRLDEFVTATRQDFFNARQVVNGHDRADKIAAQARDWLKQL